MSVTAERSVSAKCKPEHLWQKFQKIEEWPWWNRVIGQARWMHGQPWQTGSRFSLDLAYPKRIALKAAVSEIDPPNSIAWRAHGRGMRGSMRFRFEAQSDGGTLMTAAADFSGWKTMFGDGVKEALQQVLVEWLDALKSDAEKLAREQLARS